MGVTVVSAAAGSGKTTRLVQEYLRLLSRGISPRKIVAITFTRKAAAALMESVAQCLDVASGLAPPDPDYSLFADCVPVDPAVLSNASRQLMNAPVGTTDSFILNLLTEFAIDAGLPTGSGELVALDIPIGQGSALEAFRMAARQVVDPAGGAILKDAELLLQHMTLGELLDRVADLAKNGVDLSEAGHQRLMKPVHIRSMLTHLLDVAVPVVREACRAESRLFTKPVNAQQPFQHAVAPWLDKGGPRKGAPWQLLPWMAAAGQRGAAYLEDFRTQLESTTVNFGVTALPLSAALQACRGAERQLMGRAQEAREAIFRLAAATRPIGLQVAADNGLLDYDLLAMAAIHLCENPPAALQERFEALLVDEVQDANPLQERLYAALEGLIAGGVQEQTNLGPKSMSNATGAGSGGLSFYVGDSRQSIYLFRGAEPRVFDRLVSRARSEGQHDQLWTNYRSSPRLVSAQKALFAAARRQVEGLDAIDEVSHHSPNVDLSLPSLPEQDLPGVGDAPVVLVTADEQNRRSWSVQDMNEAGLEVFVQRLVHCWTGQRAAESEADEPDMLDTAVVLTTSWADADRARARVAALLETHGESPRRVVLDGQRNLTASRVCKDVWLLVRALHDREDDIAWVGLWKHPMFGLSDGALANLRQKRGLEGIAYGGLSWAVFADAWSAQHFQPLDIETFERTREPLIGALNQIGRRPTAEVIEELATSLHWRALLSAGPAGDEGVAQLEVVLDWIRSIEEEQVDPSAVITTLGGGEDNAEAPRLEMQRGPGTVSCTTVFQAKGLEWDHVYVYTIGKLYSGSRVRDWPLTRVEIGGGAQLLAGVNLDPGGGLDAQKGVVTRLAEAVEKHRQAEERLRLAYVAITRARRSVTVGLLPNARIGGIHRDLAESWLSSDLEGVVTVSLDAPTRSTLSRQGHAQVSGTFLNRVKPDGIELSRPSNARYRWKERERRKLAAHWRSAGTFLAGGIPLRPPEVPAFQTLEAWQWGELVHGWLATCGLRRDPDVDEALDFMRRFRVSTDPLIAGWLVGLARLLWVRRPTLMARFFQPGVQRHFEVPFIGKETAGEHHEEPFAWSGRLDLLVDFSGTAGAKHGTENERVCWLIDFKAGPSAPVTADELEETGKLEDYAPQLTAYRDVLETAGWRVERAGLIWVRTGAALLL